MKMKRMLKKIIVDDYPNIEGSGLENNIELHEYSDMTSKKTHLKAHTKWLKVSENTYKPIGRQTLLKVTPPGIYQIIYDDNHGLILWEKEVCVDELFVLPSDEQKDILEDIYTFWNRKEHFAKYKYTYKRGILLYGPPGNGKTSIINLISKEIIKKYSGVVFFLGSAIDLERFMSFMPKFREIEPNKQILCILEDIDSLTAFSNTETQLLSLLDGINQLDGIVFIATTNYPEKLKERILNRPSRFDKRYEIGYPSKEVREAYFKMKLTKDDLSKINLKEWIEKTENLSLSHLGELIKSVCALNNTLEDTLKMFEDMKKKISSYDCEPNKNNKIGFVGRG